MKRPVGELKKGITFRAELRGRSFVFHSTWGLFSPEEVDAGSKLLLEYLTVSPNEVALDLGCGYGALGIPIAAEARDGQVHLVDKDFTAVDCAQESIRANGLTNAKAYLSNGFSRVPLEQKFSLVVSNLPAKVGRELYDIFFIDAYAALQPGGRLVVVTIAGLKESIKKSFREVFGNYDKLKQSGTYIVACAVKN